MASPRLKSGNCAETLLPCTGLKGTNPLRTVWHDVYQPLEVASNARLTRTLRTNVNGKSICPVESTGQLTVMA